jgi:histone H3/H4
MAYRPHHKFNRYPDHLILKSPIQKILRDYSRYVALPHSEILLPQILKSAKSASKISSRLRGKKSVKICEICGYFPLLFPEI